MLLVFDKRVPTFPKRFPWPGPSLVHYSTQVGRCPCIMKLTPTTEKEPPQNGIDIRGRGGILGNGVYNTSQRGYIVWEDLDG